MEENKEIDARQMGFMIMAKYVMFFLIAAFITLILFAIGNALCDITSLLVSRSIITTLFIIVYVLFVRSYLWHMSVRHTMKNKYVNSLLIVRTFFIIACTLVLYSGISFSYAYKTTVTSNNRSIKAIENKIFLLHDDELGNSQKEVYEAQIKGLKNGNAYTIFLQCVNFGTNLGVLPIVWLALKKYNKRVGE